MMFSLRCCDGLARRGTLHLHHGTVETPIFMPVGTAGVVKTLTPQDLREMGASIILGNTYHLYLRPGLEVLKHFGGLHTFANWDRPILSDSGGYQIFSLAKQRKLTEDGATFVSHLDGRTFHLTPELAVKIQETIGSDIHMVLDECCPYPASVSDARRSLLLTTRWAARCRRARTLPHLYQFGIVQGGVYESLRKLSCLQLLEIGFDGYSIGGLSVGEPKTAMRDMTALVAGMLPQDKPRYLMGVGTPLDLVESVAMGVDMFDCVMPSRNGRNGCAFTSVGKVMIKTSRYRLDDDPLDAQCSCYTCQNFSRGYLRHLFISGELTALRLLTLHNLHFYLSLMAKVRKAIEERTFAQLLTHMRSIWT